jgi:hypothetical protein
MRPLWANRLRLPVPRSAATAPIRWREGAIDRALRELLHGRESWPTGTEFGTAGRRPPYQAIARSPGEHACWAHSHAGHCEARRWIGVPEAITPGGGGGAAPFTRDRSAMLARHDACCSSVAGACRTPGGHASLIAQGNTGKESRMSVGHGTRSSGFCAAVLGCLPCERRSPNCSGSSIRLFRPRSGPGVQ